MKTLAIITLPTQSVSKRSIRRIKKMSKKAGLTPIVIEYNGSLPEPSFDLRVVHDKRGK